MTDWGIGPAWQKPQVQDYFYQNARMYLEYYNADGIVHSVLCEIIVRPGVWYARRCHCF